MCHRGHDLERIRERIRERIVQGDRYGRLVMRYKGNRSWACRVRVGREAQRRGEVAIGADTLPLRVGMRR